MSENAFFRDTENSTPVEVPSDSTNMTVDQANSATVTENSMTSSAPDSESAGSALGGPNSNQTTYSPAAGTGATDGFTLGQASHPFVSLYERKLTPLSLPSYKFGGTQLFTVDAGKPFIESYEQNGMGEKSTALGALKEAWDGAQYGFNNAMNYTSKEGEVERSPTTIGQVLNDPSKAVRYVAEIGTDIAMDKLPMSYREAGLSTYSLARNLPPGDKDGGQDAWKGLGDGFSRQVLSSFGVDTKAKVVSAADLLNDNMYDHGSFLGRQLADNLMVPAIKLAALPGRELVKDFANNPAQPLPGTPEIHDSFWEATPHGFSETLKPYLGQEQKYSPEQLQGGNLFNTGLSVGKVLGHTMGPPMWAAKKAGDYLEEKGNEMRAQGRL